MKFFAAIFLFFLFHPSISQIKTDSLVKVNALIGYEPGENNLLPFSPKRPLTLDDFLGPVDSLSKGDAETYSGILVKYHFAHDRSQLIVTVGVFPYFDRAKSWCRAKSRNDKTLSHEQIHFDITAIKACELIREIQTTNFNLSNYSNELEKISNAKNQEAQDLQEQYDLEASHGRNAVAQGKWQEMITKSMTAQHCYQ